MTKGVKEMRETELTLEAEMVQELLAEDGLTWKAFLKALALSGIMEK